MDTDRGINGMHSVLGINFRLLESRYGVEEYNVCRVWEPKWDNESDAHRLCDPIRELCEWPDRRDFP